jgi:hypothetical protein
MTHQINLYDAALLRKRELLTAANLAAASAVLLVAFGVWGGTVRMQLTTVEAENVELASLLKSRQEQLIAVTSQVANTKPDPRLEAELAAAREQLRRHGDVLAALKRGVGAESPSFAEYLRGFARQAPKGLWLIGFSIANGGSSMEVRGRMTDAALLPEYIGRLNNEKAFRGQAFAALSIAAGKPDAATPGAPAAAAPSAYLEFTLTPVGAAPSAPPGNAAQKGVQGGIESLMPGAAEGKR